MRRPNVAMLGDDAAALLAGHHEVDHVNSFTNFEAAGLKFAWLSFVHLDLDGHGANNVMVSERKRTLDPKVFVSKRHCGNHATGLCEACMPLYTKNSLDGFTIAACYCRHQAISFGLCRRRLKV